MNDKRPLRIANISAIRDPDWIWIGDLIDPDFTIGGRRLEWTGFSVAPELNFRSELGLKVAKRVASVARFAGVRTLAAAAKRRPFDLIVTQGPWVTAWTELGLGGAKFGARHLAFSFNFTDLPTGVRNTLMTQAFRRVDALAVFTDAEQSLYQRCFGLNPRSLVRAPWGVSPPLESAPKRAIEGDYFAALGGEARDYQTLCETARRCPDSQFVAIARPHNFEGIDAPPNLSVHFNLPFEEAWGMIWHSMAALIPLRSRETPCGLVTLVGTMHLGKPQIVTDAVGVGDYVKHEVSGLLVPPKDPEAMAAAVKRLQDDRDLRARLGANAKAYAKAECSEAKTVEFFTDVLGRWFG